MFFLVLLVVVVVVFAAFVVWANRKVKPPAVRERIVGPFESSSAKPLPRSHGSGFTADEAQRLRAEAGPSHQTSTPATQSRVQAEIASLRRLSGSLSASPPVGHQPSGYARASSSRYVAPTKAPVPPVFADRDAWEDWATPIYDPYRDGREFKAALELSYRDANGQETKRRVDTERYVHDGHDGIFHAFCRLRAQRRSFRFSRVQKVVDLSTGEVISHLPRWLDRQYEQSDAGKAEAFMDEHDAALAALFYVAKADGAFRQPEKALISDFCEEQGCSVPGTVVDAMVAWEVPSAIGYGKVLKELAAMPDDYRQAVFAAAQSMSARKKTVRDTEARAVERMRKALDLPK